MQQELYDWQNFDRGLNMQGCILLREMRFKVEVPIPGDTVSDTSDVTVQTISECIYFQHHYCNKKSCCKCDCRSFLNSDMIMSALLALKESDTASARHSVDEHHFCTKSSQSCTRHMLCSLSSCAASRFTTCLPFENH